MSAQEMARNMAMFRGSCLTGAHIFTRHTHTHRQTNQAHTGTLLKRPTKDFVQHGPLTFWNLQA